jgi:hypothetical protein
LRKTEKRRKEGRKEEEKGKKWKGREEKRKGKKTERIQNKNLRFCRERGKKIVFFPRKRKDCQVDRINPFYLRSREQKVEQRMERVPGQKPSSTLHFFFPYQSSPLPHSPH